MPTERMSSWGEKPHERAVPAGTGALARGLGWFSIGLGLAQLTRPDAVGRLVGAPRHLRNPNTMRALGARELSSGLGILARKRPTGFLWSRVLGDLMDLGLLGALLRDECTDRRRTLAAFGAVLGVTALDVLASARLSRAPEGVMIDREHEVHQTITINKPPEEVYAFWRDFRNLPRFMAHLESVRTLDERRSRWVAKTLAGKSIEWEAEVVEDRPNERIGWQTRGGDVEHEGVVRFVRAPGDRGTEVHVTMRYSAPLGALGIGIAKLFGREPGQQVKGDLRRFKNVMEVGEVVHSDASIARGPHPAQPHGKLPAGFGQPMRFAPPAFSQRELGGEKEVPR